jgi:hypothetical protein
MKLAKKYIDAKGQVMYIKGKPDPSRLSYLCMREALSGKCSSIVMSNGTEFIWPFTAINEEND